jgi:hypothetical protein
VQSSSTSVDSLGVEDRAPDPRPGPPGPEDAPPGARLSLTVEQIIKIERTIVEFAEAVRVEIEDRGDGYFEVTIYGHDSVELARHTLFRL